MEQVIELWPVGQADIEPRPVGLVNTIPPPVVKVELRPVGRAKEYNITTCDKDRAATSWPSEKYNTTTVVRIELQPVGRANVTSGKRKIIKHRIRLTNSATSLAESKVVGNNSF